VLSQQKVIYHQNYNTKGSQAYLDCLGNIFNYQYQSMDFKSDDFASFSPGLIVICGATATGKTRLAIDLAQRIGGVIISADSRQVYREMDIATAKPTLVEQALVKHYLISTHEPFYTLTVAEYQQQVQELIVQLHAQQIIPILVGGTGLYIKSIVRGMKIPRVAPQPVLRSQLSTYDQTILHQMLCQVDPATKVHANDRSRTIRALEVFYVTGHSISSQQGENPPAYPIWQIGLDCENLAARIQQRTKQMVDLGWELEVKGLIDKYGGDLPGLDTLGYTEMRQYLQGKISQSEAIELTILHTGQLAKRQRTWFRNIPEIVWFDADQVDVLNIVARYLPTTLFNKAGTAFKVATIEGMEIEPGQ
jgi:tRNA dimethylallyltransferase